MLREIVAFYLVGKSWNFIADNVINVFLRHVMKMNTATYVREFFSQLNFIIV